MFWSAKRGSLSSFSHLDNPLGPLERSARSAVRVLGTPWRSLAVDCLVLESKVECFLGCQLAHLRLKI